MATLTFDTYEFIERLKSSGMDEEQAKAIADGLKEVDLEHVATKQDISELKADMLKWLVPILLGQIVVFFALVKLF